MKDIIERLLQKSTPEEEKYQIFLLSMKSLGKAGTEPSYAKTIQELLLIIQRNIKTFEERQLFSENELKEYIQKYEMFQKENMKYQIWLMGKPEDCQAVRRILNYDKIHLLGRKYTGGGIRGDYDYIIVCSNISGEILAAYEPDKIVRYDFLRFCHFGISPETAYLDMKLRKEISADTQGAVTGISYQQKGLDFNKIKRNLVCLAAPSQDLYLDFHNFKWLYDEVVCKRQGNLKYCVLGMDFYRLWYDMSLSSSRRIRMLAFYKRTRCMHHLHDMDVNLIKAEEDWKVCDELMVEDYMDEDYINSFHPERYYGKNYNEYKMTNETYSRDCEEIKRTFHKPYPHTFQENTGILDRYFKYLYLHNIKILVYIPPFPKIFNDHTPTDMKGITLNILAEYQEKYGYDVLDLSDDERFTDRHFADLSHLNCHGAELAVTILNEYMDEIWGQI